MSANKLIIIFIMLVTSFSCPAVEYRFIAGDDSAATKICLSAVQDNVYKYHKTLKSYHVTKRLAAKSVTCNKENIAIFAKRFNAVKTSAAIQKHAQLTNAELEQLNSMKAMLADSRHEKLVVVAN